MRWVLTLVLLAACGGSPAVVLDGCDGCPGPPVGVVVSAAPSPSPTPTPTPVPDVPTPIPAPRQDVPEVVAEQPPTPPVEAFLSGYRAGGGDPAWEAHLVNVVIPCESGSNPLAGGVHYGLAQFAPGTWAQACCSPGADWRSPWEQGCAVARWMSMIAPNYGTTAGWPGCWWAY